MTVGLQKLTTEISELKRKQKDQFPGSGMILLPTDIPGEIAFKMYDTYGLQRDVIEEASRLYGARVDWQEFDRAMKEQRERGRASWKGTHKEAASPAYAKLAETFRTEPDFYQSTSGKDSRIEAIITKN